MRSSQIVSHPTRWLQAIPREVRARAWSWWRKVRDSGLQDNFAIWAAVYRRTRELSNLDEQAAGIAVGLDECFKAEIRQRLGAAHR